MALSKSDREFIHEAMVNIVGDSLKPIAKMVDTHHHTLYGVTGANGLRKDVEDIKCWKHLAEVRVAKVAGMIIGGSAAASAAINFFFK